MFKDDMPLSNAEETLLTALMDGDSVRCPCCYQLAKVYKRRIYARMAQGLIEIYKSDEEFVHIPSLKINIGGGDMAGLKKWSLIEESPASRENGGRTGLWRVTKLGRAFVERRATVPEYAKMYNGVVWELCGDDISIDDALGEKFDYEELMKPVR